MDNPVERVCCKTRPCITTTDAFHDTCLNRNVLSVCILDRNDFYGDDEGFTLTITGRKGTDNAFCTAMDF